MLHQTSNDVQIVHLSNYDVKSLDIRIACPAKTYSQLSTNSQSSGKDNDADNRPYRSQARMFDLGTVDWRMIHQQSPDLLDNPLNQYHFYVMIFCIL